MPQKVVVLGGPVGILVEAPAASKPDVVSPAAMDASVQSSWAHDEVPAPVCVSIGPHWIKLEWAPMSDGRFSYVLESKCEGKDGSWLVAYKGDQQAFKAWKPLTK